MCLKCPPLYLYTFIQCHWYFVCVGLSGKRDHFYSLNQDKMITTIVLLVTCKFSFETWHLPFKLLEVQPVSYLSHGYLPLNHHHRRQVWLRFIWRCYRSRITSFMQLLIIWTNLMYQVNGAKCWYLHVSPNIWRITARVHQAASRVHIAIANVATR